MKSSLFRRTATGFAALLIAVGMAGCAVEGQTQATEPSPSAPPSSSPAVGSGVARAGALSAVATVQGWVATRNEAMATGDASEMRALTGSCRSCRALLASTWSGGFWSVDGARVTKQGSGSATVRARVSVAARRETPRHLTLSFEIGPIAGTPTITDVVVLP